ncbi:unnamed protein product, partial [Candidula unifasciata]
FFDKAKKRILGDKLEAELTQTDDPARREEHEGLSGFDPSWWGHQELGQIRNHTDSFKSIRDARVNLFVVETNKLLIRLDKLLSPEAPLDPKKRRAFEKSIVKWIADSEVPACLNCLCSFGLLTRRHHCRLCGGVMCDKCSQFMSLSFAQKLVNPAHIFSGEAFIKRTNSNSSLNSLGKSGEDALMRVCQMCRRLLQRRDHMTELRNSKPPIVQVYDKMKMCIMEAEQILPGYMNMVESLSQGETVYSYMQAQIQRSKLVKLYEVIDQLRGNELYIKTMPVIIETSSVQIKEKNHGEICDYKLLCIAHYMSVLFALPTEEEYNQLRQARAAEIQRKIAAERQAALEAQERERQEREKLDKEPSKEASSHHETAQKPGNKRAASEGQPKKVLGVKIAFNTSQKSDSRNSPDVTVISGWKPADETITVSQASDPVVQQMEIIKSYILQARQANRLDEVAMLEQNLRDLHAEYLRQKQRQKESLSS